MRAVIPCEFGGIVAISTPWYAVEIGSTPAVLGEILGTHGAPGGFHGSGDLGADRSRVIRIASAVGDRPERGRQQRLPESIALSSGAAEDGLRGGVEALERDADRACRECGELVAIVGDVRGRQDGIGQGSAAEPFEQLRPGVNRAGHGDGERAFCRHRVVAGTANECRW